MRGVVSSARMRRRAAWASAFLLLAGAVAGLVILFPSPGHQDEGPVRYVRGGLPPNDESEPFRPRQAAVLKVARKFVATAVTRHHTARSWNLVAPSLKRGFTRRKWGKGEIPVPPFPVYAARWRLGYSFKNEVEVQVALFAKPKKNIRPAVFNITLHRFRRHGHDRWLVSSFLPAPAGGSDYGGARLAETRLRSALVAQAAPPRATSRASGAWMLVPAGVLGALLAVGLVLGFRSWRSARIYRAYVRERRTSTSSPS